MRPIKFRAWDKLKNRMLKVQSVAFSDSGEVTSIYTYGADFSNDKQVLMGEKPDLDSAVLEQYTGLKDSNGLEIYEGDLVKIFAIDGDSFIAPVKYHADINYPGFDVDEHYVPDSWCFLANALQTVIFDGSKILAVGNIHENPELLEAEK